MPDSRRNIEPIASAPRVVETAALPAVLPADVRPKIARRAHMIGYIGGKQRLAPQLVALFPAHTAYVEPFCGMANVLLCKSPSAVEVLNDRNEDVVTFLRVCQHHHTELLRYVRYAVNSRRLFELYKRQDPSTLTDVQRAARFLYMQRTGFGGRVAGPTFGTAVISPPRTLEPARLSELLAQVAQRLERVQLECLSYQDTLRRYDRESSFFYCDPPYVDTKAYPHNFSEADYRQLAEHLAGLTGKFLLSPNDHPLAREIFGRFFCREVYVGYSVSRMSRRTVKELVFSNYEPEGQTPALASHARDRRNRAA